MEKTKDSLNDADPWMKSKFSDSEASKAEDSAEEPKAESENTEQKDN